MTSEQSVGTLAEQARDMKDALMPQGRTRNSATSEKTLQQIGQKFVLRAFSQDSMERGVEVGKLLDEIHLWVKSCVEGLMTAWDGIPKTEEGGNARAALQEKAGILLNEFQGLLAGKGISGVDELTLAERALVARVAAVYYAGYVWSADDIPADETFRALRFLLQTGAARITRDEPAKGMKNIRVLHRAWITFPYVSAGEVAPDVRAMDKSGILVYGGAIAHAARADADGFKKSRESALRGSVVFSSSDAVKAFLQKPHAGKIALSVLPKYAEKTNWYLSGGMVSTVVRGDDESGYSLHVEDVFDRHALSSLRDASERSKEAQLPPEIRSFSSSLRAALPKGTYFSAIEIPMDFFKVEDLRNWRVNIGGRRYPADVSRAVREIVLVVRRAFLNEMYERKPARTKEAEFRREAPVPPSRGGERKTGTQKVTGEITEDLNAVVAAASAELHLPVLAMVEFFSPKRPQGVTLAEAPGVLRVEEKEKISVFKEIACVLVRHEDGAKAEVRAFPPRLKELFSGLHGGLVFAKLIRHAKWLFYTNSGRNSGSAQPPQESAPPEKETETAHANAKESDCANPATPLTAPVPGEEAQAQPEADGQNGSEESAHPAAAKVNLWASPQARALAEELGIDGEEITPHNGRKVTKAEVEAYAERKTAS